MTGKKSGLGRGLDALFPEKTVQSKPKTTVKTAKQTKTTIPETKKSSQHENSNGERMMKLSMIEAKQRTATPKNLMKMHFRNWLILSNSMEYCNLYSCLIKKTTMR